MALLERFKLCLIVFGALLAVQSVSAGNWNSSSGELKIDSGKRKEVSKFRDYSLISDTRVVRAGDSSQRFEIRHGDCGKEPGYDDCANDRRRIERVKESTSWHGKVIWYGFSIFIPEDFQELDPSNTTLTQVKLVSFRQPLWDFNARGRYFSFEANASNQTCYAIKLDDMRGKWTDIALGIDYSTKKTSNEGIFDGSFYELWINGDRKPCAMSKGPVLTTKMIKQSGRSRIKLHFDWGIYNSYVSRWFDRNKTKKPELQAFVDKHDDSGLVVRSSTNRPFDVDWGVNLPTQIVYYDEIRYGPSREDVDITLLEKKANYTPVD